MDRKRQKLNPEKIMASNDESLNINSLPEEMLINIFCHLSQNELGRIARVCRSWNVLTKRPTLWKEVNVKFHKSHKSQNTVTRCFIEMLPSCVTRIKLDFYHFGIWTEQLNCEEFCARLQKICPHLEKLNLEGALLSCRIQSVIDLCTRFLPKVKILILKNSKFSDCSLKEELGNSSKIEVLDLSLSWFGFLNKLPFSRMPQLKQLHLSYSYVCCYWLEDDISFLNQLQVLDVGYTHVTSNVLYAIQYNRLNLKELFLCNSFILDHDLKFNNSVFPHLKTICVRGCPNVTCEGVVSLIQLCRSLQIVYVGQGVIASYAAHPFIIANRCKLEIVKFIPDCNEHRRVVY